MTIPKYFMSEEQLKAVTNFNDWSDEYELHLKALDEIPNQLFHVELKKEKYEFVRQLRVKIKRGVIKELKDKSYEKVVSQIVEWIDELHDRNTLGVKPLWKLLDEIREDEREKLLNKLSKRINDISETAEMPCQDGYHTGDHSTDVVRVSYLEEEMENLRNGGDEK